jgi:hypothetical protein
LLQAVQIIGGALRVRRGGEDGALVVLQDFQPGGDVAGVILARFGCDAEVDAQEGRSELGDQLLGGVAFIAPAFAAEFAGQARGVPGPVRKLDRRKEFMLVMDRVKIGAAWSAWRRVRWSSTSSGIRGFGGKALLKG